MKPFGASLPKTRREFLQAGGRGIGLLACSRFAPAFLVDSVAAAAPAPERDRTVLVLVQLAGGNDGLNTVVPRVDPHYRRLRPTLALGADAVLPIDDVTGLHHACAPLRALLQEGRLGIVQNVGYPNPNRSHFRSTEIWETASASHETLPTGWIGRYFDHACAGRPGGALLGVSLSKGVPQSFQGAEPHASCGFPLQGHTGREGRARLELVRSMLREAPGKSRSGESNAGYLRHTVMDALVTERRFQRILADYRPSAAYPGGPFAASLRNVAALIAAGSAIRVYSIALGGFDTHADQANAHANLLRTLSEGLAAFQGDLEAKRLGEQVLTMTFSEFGRRPAENESRGTDHGTAAPLFVLGSKVKAGLHGRAPDLGLEPDQDLAYSTDFRAVYATVLERWLGADPRVVLGGGNHAPLAFL